MIVASESAVDGRDYPLLLLSKGRKRREYIRALIANREVEYIRYAHLLYPNDVHEELRMSKTKESYAIEANLRFIVNSVAWGAFVKSVGLNEMVKVAGPENVMRALVNQLGPEKAREILEQVRSDGQRSRRRKKHKKRKRND